MVLDTKLFIEKLNKIWGDRYDTSECVYEGSMYDVTLTCKLHNYKFDYRAALLVQSKPRTGCKCCQKELLKELKTSEDDIQIEFVSWMKNTHPELIFTCNGLFNNKALVERSYKMGYKVGIPDLFILNHQLFIELKSQNGKLSDKQIECQEQIRKLGYKVITCWTLDDAKNVINEVCKL
jgi:hypothetical protein